MKTVTQSLILRIAKPLIVIALLVPMVASAQLVSGPVSTPMPTAAPTATPAPAAIPLTYLDTDPTGAADSDSKVMSQKATKDYVDAKVPYLVYTALLTQSGTDAPVATVLQNTLSGPVVWSYAATGEYRGTLAGAFLANKVPTICGVADLITNHSAIYKITRLNDNEVALYVLYDGSADDSRLTDTFINIPVYP